jgi:hypothetical protein
LKKSIKHGGIKVDNSELSENLKSQIGSVKELMEEKFKNTDKVVGELKELVFQQTNNLKTQCNQLETRINTHELTHSSRINSTIKYAVVIIAVLVLINVGKYDLIGKVFAAIF